MNAHGEVVSSDLNPTFTAASCTRLCGIPGERMRHHGQGWRRVGDVRSDPEMVLPNVITPTTTATTTASCPSCLVRHQRFGHDDTYHIQVYNRWGDVGFENDGIPVQWDCATKYPWILDRTSPEPAEAHGGTQTGDLRTTLEVIRRSRCTRRSARPSKECPGFRLFGLLGPSCPGQHQSCLGDASTSLPPWLRQNFRLVTGHSVKHPTDDHHLPLQSVAEGLFDDHLHLKTDRHCGPALPRRQDHENGWPHVGHDSHLPAINFNGSGFECLDVDEARARCQPPPSQCMMPSPTIPVEVHRLPSNPAKRLSTDF